MHGKQTDTIYIYIYIYLSLYARIFICSTDRNTNSHTAPYWPFQQTFWVPKQRVNTKSDRDTGSPLYRSGRLGRQLCGPTTLLRERQASRLMAHSSDAPGRVEYLIHHVHAVSPTSQTDPFPGNWWLMCKLRSVQIVGNVRCYSFHFLMPVGESKVLPTSSDWDLCQGTSKGFWSSSVVRRFCALMGPNWSLRFQPQPRAIYSQSPELKKNVKYWILYAGTGSQLCIIKSPSWELHILSMY